MASDNTVQITVNVAAEQADKALQAVQVALKGMGTSATTAKAPIKEMHGEMANMEVVLGRVHTALFKTIGALSLIGAGAILAKKAFDEFKTFVTASIDAVDRFRTQSLTLATIMTDLSTKKGPETWRMNLAYATAEMEKMREAAAKMGVTWEVMEKAQRAFADVGIVADSKEQMQAMVEVAAQAKAIAVTRHADIGSLMQIKELLVGQVADSNQLATVLRTNLGLTNEQLKVWIQAHLNAKDLPQAMAKAFGMTKDQIKDINSTLQTQGVILRENIESIERHAAGGAWKTIEGALERINTFLIEHGDEIASRLAPAWDELGKIINDAASYIMQNWESIVSLLNTGVEILGGMVLLVKDILAVWNDIAGVVKWLNDHLPTGQTAAADTSGESGREGQQAGGKSFLPPHAVLQTPKLEKKGGADEEPFRAALDAVEQWVRHQMALNSLIDDAVKKQKDQVRILEEARQKYLEVEKAASGKHAAREAREARDKILELEDTMIREKGRLSKLSVEQRLQDAESYLARLKELNEISLQDELAYRLRELEYDKLTDRQRTELLHKAAIVKKEIKAKELKDHKDHLIEMFTAEKDAYEQQLVQIQLRVGQADNARQREKIVSQAAKGFFSPKLGTVDTSGEQAEIGDSQARVSALREELALDKQNVETLRAQLALLTDAKDKREKTKEIDQAIVKVKNDELTIEKEQNTQLAARLRMAQNLWKPVQDQINAVTGTIESSFTTAFENVLTGQEHFGKALLGFFASIGKSIIHQIGSTLAKGLVNSLDLQGLLGNMFGALNKGILGGVASPQEAMATAMSTTFPASTTTFVGGVEQFGLWVQQFVAAQTTGGAAGAVGGDAAGGIFNMILRGAGGILPGAFRPFASGGMAYGPTFGLVGEAGPEAVIPLKGGRVPVEMSGGSRGGTIVIHAWDTQTGMDQLYKHRDFLADMWAEQRSVNDRNVRRSAG